MTTVFNGKRFAQEIEKTLSKKVLQLNLHPRLAAIYIGQNKASEIYLDVKQKAARNIGAEIIIHKFSASTTTEKVLQLIKVLNSDSKINGIMVQLPVPETIDKARVLSLITPAKDVDGHLENSPFMPATVKAVLKIIKAANVGERASVVVIGEDGEVGKRLVKVLRNEKFSVMGVDITTQNPLEVTRMADVLISATGRSVLVTKDWVKDNAVVIDVGAPLAEVDFTEVSKKASFITPVPGGVGPVTVASLLENLVESATM